MESREDTYLLDPQLSGLSVKVRGGGALEVKAYRGSPGILEVAHRATGRMEFWQKWSFPSTLPSPGGTEAAGWRPVRKKRRISRFPLASGQIPARGPELGQEPGCKVELTEVHTCGQDWWSLGLEANGPADLLRSELETTATLVFAQPLPSGMEPGPDDSRSYAEWLCRRRGGKMTCEACPSAGPTGPVLPATPGTPDDRRTGDGTGRRPVCARVSQAFADVRRP